MAVTEEIKMGSRTAMGANRIEKEILVIQTFINSSSCLVTIRCNIALPFNVVT